MKERGFRSEVFFVFANLIPIKAVERISGYYSVKAETNPPQSPLVRGDELQETDVTGERRKFVHADEVRKWQKARSKAAD